jgi:hypothetical protein
MKAIKIIHQCIKAGDSKIAQQICKAILLYLSHFVRI